MLGRILRYLAVAFCIAFVSSCMADEDSLLMDGDVPCTVKVAGIVADGTVMTLSPGSVAKVQLRVDPRHVELDGDAYFEVTRDESHPFTVAAGEGAVKVLGTRFLVSSGLDGTSVDVTEGKVLFSAAGSEEGVILTKGMSATLPMEMNVPTLV